MKQTDYKYMYTNPAVALYFNKNPVKALKQEAKQARLTGAFEPIEFVYSLQQPITWGKGGTTGRQCSDIIYLAQKVGFKIFSLINDQVAGDITLLCTNASSGDTLQYSKTQNKSILTVCLHDMAKR